MVISKNKVGARKTEYSHAKINKVGTLLYTTCKISLKTDQKLNVRVKTTKLLEGSKEGKLHDMDW